ncbi:hypothetical protein EJ110_NYTH60341, partial [Nymphaea thermarum]
GSRVPLSRLSRLLLPESRVFLLPLPCSRLPPAAALLASSSSRVSRASSCQSLASSSCRCLARIFLLPLPCSRLPPAAALPEPLASSSCRCFSPQPHHTKRTKTRFVFRASPAGILGFLVCRRCLVAASPHTRSTVSKLSGLSLFPSRSSSALEQNLRYDHLSGDARVGIAMEGTSNSRNDSLVWTDAQLEYLINLLVQQSRLPGMKSGANLKPKAYKAIEQKMIEQFGPGFTVEKIKNKLKITKADYNICKQILATSGFGWDPTNKCVEVEHQVWADYIEPQWMAPEGLRNEPSDEK